jgi:hypothetical protein
MNMTDKNQLLLNIVESDDSSTAKTFALNPANSEASINSTEESGVQAFEAALTDLDIHSIFDIIRMPKSAFSRQLSELTAQYPALNKVNAELTYDHAMCYAIQIGRLHREQQTSSIEGISTSSDAPRYENLFQEKWGEFCKVGAISAIDSPVAYLTSLYRLITTVVEPEGQGTRPQIKLDDRRPDLKDLQINQQTTFTPLPMLTIVNDVLSKNIEAFLGNKADPLPEQLAQKRHPFVFPYHFAHHQCVLGLSNKNTPLGDINYRISQQLPLLRNASNEFGKHSHSSAMAQGLLSGLSAEQQLLVTEPTLFSDFYIPKVSVNNNTYYSPGASAFAPLQELEFGFVLPPQNGIKSSTPQASALTGNVTQRYNTVAINFTKPGSPTVTLNFSLASHRPETPQAENQVMTSTYQTGIYTKALAISLLPGQTLPPEAGYTATFHVLVTADNGLEVPDSPQKAFIKRSFTLCLDDDAGWDYLLPESEQVFFNRHYGLRFISSAQNPLVTLGTFMTQTGLDAANVEALLAVRGHDPKISPNCRSLNPLQLGIRGARPFPHSSHYGASYVNGVGSRAPDFVLSNHIDNAMDLQENSVGDDKVWRMKNTSLNRFDRLQRMIRLQRWMDIPFAELDTLIVAAMRAEGEANLEMALNDNTLRTLGVFRHLNQRYGIKAEEFAAFLHHLSPYADTDRTPLFDEVFNSPALFDTPLILDQTPFDPAGDGPDDQKTVYQLCAGLGVQPTETSFDRLANNTREYVGPLSRSLTIVSSLYRQARIARMFGLSVEDSGALADLLGGNAYVQALTTGALRTADTAPDILDVLMQMDWAVAWLKESKQSIGSVRAHVGLDGESLVPTQALVDRLTRLHQDAHQSLITDQQVRNLNLPNTPAQSIDWLAELKKVLVNDIGLVKALPLQQVEDLKGQLDAALTALIEPLGLDTEAQKDAQTRLCEFLLIVHDRQLRLIEGVLQELAKLHMDRAAVVTHWAGLSTEVLLKQLIEAMNAQRLTVENFDPALLTSLQCLLRHAGIALAFNLSELALRLFVVSPQWLGAPMIPDAPSLASLYLLERYSHLVNDADVPGAELLNYLSVANFKGPPTSEDDTLATALAQLLKWTKNEVLTLAQHLPEHKATTLAHVDWLYRCKKLSQTNGLSATSLLLAVKLNPQSPAAEWHAVGNAAMAASL